MGQGVHTKMIQVRTQTLDSGEYVLTDVFTREDGGHISLSQNKRAGRCTTDGLSFKLLAETV